VANASRQGQRPAPLTKVTPPRLPNVVERTRLYRLLDRARKRPIVWITAPPGYGKTTLVASYLRARKLRPLWYQVDEGDGDLASFFHYLGLAVQQAAHRLRTPLPHLTPEYRQGLPTFTRRYFEDLYGRLRLPAVLVFDNYQEVSPASTFHEMVAVGIGDVPAGISVIVISRMPPSPSFAHLQADQKIAYFEQEALRLTAPESRAIVRLHTRPRKGAIPPGFTAGLHDKLQGWVAGLVLILEQERTESVPQLLAAGQAPQVIFDYLAREVMKALSVDVQHFLMKTAFLRQMTAAMAQRLTGVTSAGVILADLYQSRYFTERRWAVDYVYQYHPLFQEFLLAHATTLLSPHELRDSKQTAASLLEEAGRIEEAVALYREAGQMSEIVRVILTRGPELLSQGRTDTLDLWLRYVPAELYEQEPWLYYWLGSCRLAVAPLESTDIFERAFVRFRAKDNKVGMLMAWAAIISSIQFSWIDFSRMDPWIDVLLDLVPPDASFPSQEIETHVTFCMVTALMLRRPHATLVRPWLDRAKKLLESTPVIEKSLALSAAMTHRLASVGDLSSAEKYLNRLQSAAESETASALTRMVFYENKAVLDWHCGNSQRAVQTAEQGLEISQKTGVRLFDTGLLGSCIYGSLFQNDLVRAEKYLRQCAPLVSHPAHFMRGNFLFMQAWVARLKGDLPKSWDHIQEGFEIKGVKGTLFAEALFSYAAADILHRLGDDRHASEYLKRVKHIAEEMGSAILQFKGHLIESHIALDQRHEDEGLSALRQGLALGREKGFSFFPWWLPQMMTRLCAKALETNIEVEYVQQLIRKTRLIPDSQVSEAWPWSVKIYSLGIFEIHLDSKPLPRQRKKPYRLLELLKVLVGLGPKEVAIPRLIDALWPEAEGDRGEEAFHKTLQRLRRFLAHDRVIKIADGKVSLNRDLCWVDAWSFEDLLQRVDGHEKDSCIEMADVLSYEQAVLLYRGPFLGDDDLDGWADRREAQLRQKFIQSVEKLSDWRVTQQQFDLAARCLKQAIKVDPIAESLCSRLLTVLHTLGRQNEARMIWTSYCRALSTMSRCEPSLELKRLAQRLLSQ
jgi:DNA-binding SARP family transcriptional activator